jgi:pimeloyl-ACP methyl ester carboxylesterase
MKAKPTIVMVHGAFCGGWVFEAFRRPFERGGYSVLAPDLPGHRPGSKAADVQGLSISRFADAIVAACGELPERPILLGHSLGGLVVQLAAARAPVAALLLLAPSPPWGVTLASPEEALAAMSLHALGPYWSQAIEPDRFAARRYLLDQLDEAARAVALARLTAESGRALFETLNWWLDPFAATLVRVVDIAAPAFAVAGGRDVINPPATVEAAVSRLGGETRVFEDMGHWLIGEPGWEAVAEACLVWLSQVLVGAGAAGAFSPA